MTSIVAVIRVFLLALLLLVGLIAGTFSLLIPFDFYQKVASRWHRCVVWICGIRCEYSGSSVEPDALLVSNHISWLDISILGSVTETVFLANAEIKRWPIVGYMVARAGTLFIARGKGSNQAIGLISDALNSGQSVLVFPEAKTTDGLGVCKFHPRLFQGAINAKGKVQPISLTYLQSDGSFTSVASYVGNLNFLDSMWNTVKSRGVVVKVHVFSAFSASGSRDDLAKQAVTLINRHRKSL